MKTQRNSFHISHIMSLMLVFLLTLCILTSCSSSNGVAITESYKANDASSYSYTQDAPSEYDYELGGSGDYSYSDTQDESYSVKQADETVKNPEKLVYSANVSLETMEFEKTIQAVRRQIAEYGGILQSESYSDDMPSDYYYGYDSYYGKVSGYKSFYATIRIPTENFQKFLDTVATVGHLRSSSSQVTNITQEYYSNQSYLDSYNAQMEVLQSMYDEAKTIDEMIQIESRIAEVQAYINKLTTVISSMDRDVAYSTVSLHIDEVTVYSDTPREVEEKSFLENIKTHFVNSFADFVDGMKEFVYWLIDSMWGLMIFALIIVFLVWLIRRIVRKHIEKKEKEAPQTYTANADSSYRQVPAQEEQNKASDEPKKF